MADDELKDELGAPRRADHDAAILRIDCGKSFNLRDCRVAHAAGRP